MSHFRFALSVSLLALTTPAFAWWVSLQGGPVSTPRGHEEITWQGIAMAQPLLQASNLTEDGLPFFPLPSRGDGGSSTANFILMGNYSVDRPDDLPVASDQVMNLRHAFGEYFGLGGSIDWHNAVQMQALHFMRQFDANEAWSSRYSCEKAKDVIVFASTRAVANWTEAFDPERSVEEMRRSRDRAHFWVGVALHTIQDSFSPVHTQRETGGKTKIRQLCTYVKEFDGVCNHDTVDDDDNVWQFNLPPVGLPPTPAQGAALLTPLAQTAALATRDYLVKMGMQFHMGMKRNDQLLAIDTTYLRLVEFFHDSEPEGSGRFWCPISPVMRPNKDLFQFGEKIQVKFSEQVGRGPAAYLGMLRKEAPHVARPLPSPGAEPGDEFVSWYNFDGTVQQEGLVDFGADRAGDWEIRLFDTAGAEQMVTALTVAPGLRVPSTPVATGAAFKMEFGADARWPVHAFIALVPAGTAETAEATKTASTQFLKLNQRETGNVTVTAPPTAGTYEMRMFTAGGTATGATLAARGQVQVH